MLTNSEELNTKNNNNNIFKVQINNNADIINVEHTLQIVFFKLKKT